MGPPRHSLVPVVWQLQQRFWFISSAQGRPFFEIIRKPSLLYPLPLTGTGDCCCCPPASPLKQKSFSPVSSSPSSSFSSSSSSSSRNNALLTPCLFSV